MSIELLELAADALDGLLDEVAFVGGATLALWITDPAAPPVRPTKDVVVVVEVATRSAYRRFEQQLRQRSFQEDQEDGRGRGDFLGSRDFADVVTLIDGRAELVDELRDADAGVRGYVAEQLASAWEHPRFLDGVFGALRPDAASQARADVIVLPRLRALVAASDRR